MQGFRPLIATIVAASLALFADVANAEASSPVRLGFSGRLSEAIVQSALRGAELALDDANKKAIAKGSGLRFELLPQDDQGSENFAINVANYLVKQRVAGVVGPWSSDAALATAKIYEDARVPQVGFTATTSQWTSQGNRMPFRVVGGTSDVATWLAEVAVKMLQGRRIVIVQNESVYSKAISSALAEKIANQYDQSVTRFIISNKTSDFNGALTSSAGKNADVVVFVAQYPQAAPFLEAVKRQKSGAKILFVGGASNNSAISMANSQLYVLEYDISYDHCPRWKVFSQDYVRKYNSQPTTYSRYAYNAASILAESILRIDSTDGNKLAAALHRNKHQGLSGEITFLDNGDASKPAYTLYRFDGQWHPIEHFPKGARSGERCP